MSATFYPATYTNQAVKSFVVNFFKQSDVKPPAPAEAKDPYVAQFTPQATMKLASATASASEGIAALRQNMWTKVTKRHHVVQRVFPFSDPDAEVQDIMMQGYVEFDLINGKSLVSEWSSHMVFDKVDNWEGVNAGDLKLTSYQVYLDPTPVKEALEN